MIGRIIGGRIIFFRQDDGIKHDFHRIICDRIIFKKQNKT
jgi:hypothetical protein